MKKNLISIGKIFLGIIIGVGLSSLLNSNKSLNDKFSEYFDNRYFNQSNKSKSIVSINNKMHLTEEIAKNEFEAFAFIKRLNVSDGTVDVLKFQKDQFINQNLIIEDGIKKGIYKSRKFNEYLWLNFKDAAVRYYLMSEIEKDFPASTQSVVTPEMVEKIYVQYKKQYEELGLSENEIKFNIRTSIKSEEQQRYMTLESEKVLNKLKLENSIKIKE